MGSERIEITETIRAKLNSLRLESGVSADALLRGRRKDAPEGLKPHMIHSWLNGRVSSAKQEHLEYVLEKWLQAMDDPSRPVKVSAVDLRFFAEQIARTNATPKRLLSGRADAPKGVNTKFISKLTRGKLKTVRKEQIDYVMERFLAMPDLARM